MHTTPFLPLWQSHQQLNETAALAYVRESRWRYWVEGKRLLGWCWWLRGERGGGRLWHSESFSCWQEGQKKREESYCPHRSMPRSSLWPSKFLAMADIWSSGRWRNPLIPCPMSYSLVQRSVRQGDSSNHGHTEIRGRKAYAERRIVPNRLYAEHEYFHHQHRTE